MTEGDKGTAAGPYTDAARARLVAAYEACELAELARAAVPIGEHELHPDGTVRSPGSVLADAARVLRAAQRFFEAAAVFERVGGADWERVGDVLGVPAHSARARFTTAEDRFRRGPLSPAEATGPTGPTGPAGSLGELSWWRAYMAREPLEAALDLDDWVLRHQDGDSGLGSAPVSGGLARKR
ncbi:hypothetical protein [Streptomyces bluensis]|uniref:hypothetical protein n=1 Tax=Streptomyces bluensis TaxID=33897 RepID=UPI00167A9BCF|nr:hypothetical protein [Streptomyces bluensis]GGZ41823.1 hypothetical protein GCM10010344_03330 [Streptomyces bluensis]